MSEAQGYKGGLRGAQMFKRRVDQLFEIIDEATPDPQFTGHQNKALFHMDVSMFKRIDATTYFGLYDDDILIPTDQSLTDDGKPRVWPFRHSLLVSGKPHEDDGFGEDSFQCHVLRSCPAESVRGRARIYSNYMVSNDIMVIYKVSGYWRFSAASLLYALVGRRWVQSNWHSLKRNGHGHGGELPPNIIMPGVGDVQSLSRRLDLSMSWAEAAKAIWFVEIGRRGSLSFQFATLPGKISGIFKARELKDGEARRSALKNWVTDHWRTDANDPEFEIYVRKHLRGSETFSWGDYFCTIHPAPTDLEEAKHAAEERALMGEQARRRKFVEKPRVRVQAVSRPL